MYRREQAFIEENNDDDMTARSTLTEKDEFMGYPVPLRQLNGVQEALLCY